MWILENWLWLLWLARLCQCYGSRPRASLALISWARQDTLPNCSSHRAKKRFDSSQGCEFPPNSNRVDADEPTERRSNYQIIIEEMDGVKVIPVNVKAELCVIGFMVETTLKEALRVSSLDMPTPSEDRPRWRWMRRGCLGWPLIDIRDLARQNVESAFLTQGFMLICILAKQKIAIVL